MRLKQEGAGCSICGKEREPETERQEVGRREDAGVYLQEGERPRSGRILSSALATRELARRLCGNIFGQVMECWPRRAAPREH